MSTQVEARKSRPAQTYDPRVCQVAWAVHEAVQPKYVIVFGSRARGDYNQDSDIDLLVVMADEPARDTYTKAAQAAFEVVRELYDPPVDVDVVDMSLDRFMYTRRAPNHVAGQAVREGVTMHGEIPPLPSSEEQDPWPDIEQRLTAAWRNLQDLEVAIEVGRLSPEAVGFFAQQAVENALKAWISALGGRYRTVHDLAELTKVIRRFPTESNTNAGEALAWLTIYAVQYRYEGARVEMEDVYELLERIEDLCHDVSARIKELYGRAVVPSDRRTPKD